MKKILTCLVAMLMLGCSSEKAKLAESAATKSFLEENWQQIIDNSKRWVEADSENPVPHALLNLAYTHMEMHDALRAELKIAYSSPERIKQVQKWAIALVKSNEKNPRAYWLEGIAFESTDNNAAAIQAYRKSMEVDPSFKQGYEALGNYYLASRNYRDAFSVYTQLLEKFPDYGPAYNHVGTVFAVTGQSKSAIKCFLVADKIEPNNLVNMYNLASAYMQNDQNAEAYVILKKIVKLDPFGEVGIDAQNKLNKFKLQ